MDGWTNAARSHLAADLDPRGSIFGQSALLTGGNRLEMLASEHLNGGIVMNACDTATALTRADASCLLSSHHAAIGRYLKSLMPTEVAVLHKAGLKLWLIFEEGEPVSTPYFSAAQGKSDARRAVIQAQGLDIPHGKPIFFVVDYAPAPSDETAILDYFQGVASEMASHPSPYGVGVYGTYTVMWWLWNDSRFNNEIRYWQTEGNGSCGWVFPFNDLYQVNNMCNAHPVKSCGVSIDADYVLNTEVLW